MDAIFDHIRDWAAVKKGFGHIGKAQALPLVGIFKASGYIYGADLGLLASRVVEILKAGEQACVVRICRNCAWRRSGKREFPFVDIQTSIRMSLRHREIG